MVFCYLKQLEKILKETRTVLAVSGPRPKAYWVWQPAAAANHATGLA
jgi:hypothetical protein